MSKPIIRPVTKDDNVEIAAVVRKVLMDLGAPKVGTAYACLLYTSDAADE